MTSNFKIKIFFSTCRTLIQRGLPNCMCGDEPLGSEGSHPVQQMGFDR